jgi:hypothetical protein
MLAPRHRYLLVHTLQVRKALPNTTGLTPQGAKPKTTAQKRKTKTGDRRELHNLTIENDETIDGPFVVATLLHIGATFARHNKSTSDSA